MKRLILSILFISGVFVACAPYNGGATLPLSTPHSTPEVQDTNLCSAAELNLKKYSCIPNDKPYTAKGKSFTQFCQETQNNGIFLNPKCLSELTDCGVISSCTN